MVNFGRSGACITCKQRKVKCDESRPGCQKCHKIGKSCPGYPDKWDLAFRNENKIIQRKVQWKQKALEEFPSAKLLMLENALADERLQALCLFFQDYTISTCGICPGWLHFLPKMYQMSAATSLLHHAVCTAAYANLAQKTERPDLAIMAMSHYRESLEVVKQTLVFPGTAFDDSTMTGVILLGIYECINSTLVEGSYHHISGLETLADLRGSLLMQGYGPSLLQTVCCQMLRRILDRRVPPSSVDERLVKLLDPSLLGNEMIINKLEISKFIANVDAKILSGQIQRHWDEILLEFERLEGGLFHWNMRASQEFGFVQVQQPTFIDDKKPFVYHSYLGFWSLSLWNKHRAARILLHQTLLDGLDAMDSGRLSSINQDQKSISKSVIKEMADFILLSIPFSLGDVPLPPSLNGPKSVGGYFLVWSLQVLLRCPSVSDDQQNQAKNALLRIGRRCGLSYATIFAKKYGNSSPTQIVKHVPPQQIPLGSTR
ncbi:uncharacterized protein LY89DRAFT_740831 [Mollisia scopiformis]|uniref:Zn(2)-C6 fungal-type domain-containing protein n=1 Tax=Mollisia scopiformis TaxID=149040 RepID=A0A132BCN6_MOLSC|nr:uncharacterized protein LY89DRAFT_740831 [Mollisia scopiformis]KUJ09759.1 hypothetical protein LY89DRAFT_740831 [Mollisia scopiformis]